MPVCFITEDEVCCRLFTILMMDLNDNSFNTNFLLINCCELNGDTLCRAIMWK